MFVRGLAAVAAAALVALDATAAGAVTLSTSAPARTAAPSSSVEPGTLSGGRPSQTGWWSRSNEPPPDTGLAAPPTAPEPTVPEGSLAVAALLGEQNKVTAVELALEGEAGGLVEELTLSLRESTADGVNAGAEQASIIACPITESFWVPTEAGQWKHRPKHDCEAGQATGSRDESGVWTFDLTALAGQWTSPTFTGSRGVVLTGAPAAADAPPPSFQVVFDGVEAEGIGVRAVVGDAPDAAPPSDGVTAPAGDVPTPGTGGGGAGGFGDVTGGVGGLDAPVAAAGDVPTADLPAAPADAAPAPVAATGQAAPELVSASPVAPAAWYSGLGLPAVLLLVLALGLAYLVMVALGPDAQPAPGQGRRGVSRALDRMRAVGANLKGARA